MSSAHLPTRLPSPSHRSRSIPGRQALCTHGCHRPGIAAHSRSGWHPRPMCTPRRRHGTRRPRRASSSPRTAVEGRSESAPPAGLLGRRLPCMETESAAAPPMVHSSAGEGNPHTRTAHTNRLIFSLLYINGYVTAREPRRSYTHVGSSNRETGRRLSDPHIIITTRQRRPWGHTFVRGSRHTGQHAPCSVAPAHRLTPDGAVRAVVQERGVRRHTTLQRPYRYLSSAAELSAAGEGARIGGSPIAKCRPPQPRCTSPCSCEQRRLCG